MLLTRLSCTVCTRGSITQHASHSDQSVSCPSVLSKFSVLGLLKRHANQESASAPVQSKAMSSSSAILSAASAPERFAILCTEHLQATTGALVMSNIVSGIARGVTTMAMQGNCAHAALWASSATRVA